MTSASTKRHRWRSEGFHGEAKTWHGLARVVRRGLDNMRISPSYSVRPNGAVHQWREVPPRKFSQITATPE